MRPNRAYWSRAEKIGRSVFGLNLVDNVDEQAGPAYFAGLRLSRWIFWQRLRMAIEAISLKRGGQAVDFGCGFGLTLPALRENFDRTIGIDLVPDLSIEFLRQWDEGLPVNQNQREGHSQPPNHLIAISRSIDEARLADNSVDLILALDVLEHFESLADITTQFRRILKPNGVLIVSGPTENLFYNIGRRIVGFSGDYHRQNVYQVMKSLSEQFAIRVIHRFPKPMPLFLIFEATLRLPSMRAETDQQAQSNRS